MKDKGIPIIAAVVLVLAAISIARSQPKLETHSPPAAPPRSAFEARVAAAGLVEPASENISIAPHLPGVVEKVFVVAGQKVKRGDPLVKLDTRALESALGVSRAEVAQRAASIETAKARVARAEAALAEGRRSLGFAERAGDSRSLSQDELSRRRGGVEMGEADLAAAKAELAAAEAGLEAAKAGLASVETDLERSVARAPIDATILQARIRPGEFVAASSPGAPWLVLGDISKLHVRVDIDEHEAWKVRPGAAAVAQVRGNARLELGAKFLRFEPLVIPKVSLTGSSAERVDTRVLQAIYELAPGEFPIFPGQQMDVFIDASGVN